MPWQQRRAWLASHMDAGGGSHRSAACSSLLAVAQRRHACADHLAMQQLSHPSEHGLLFAGWLTCSRCRRAWALLATDRQPLLGGRILKGRLPCFPSPACLFVWLRPAASVSLFPTPPETRGPALPRYVRQLKRCDAALVPLHLTRAAAPSATASGSSSAASSRMSRAWAGPGRGSQQHRLYRMAPAGARSAVAAGYAEQCQAKCSLGWYSSSRSGP